MLGTRSCIFYKRQIVEKMFSLGENHSPQNPLVKTTLTPQRDDGTFADAWRVNRDGEGRRFSKFDSIDNRHLL